MKILSSSSPASRLLQRVAAGGRPLSPVCLFLAVLVASSGASVATARTLRLFVVGNSFSNNATRYLPDLAKADGHELIMARAQTGGCSLERHWNALEAALAHPGDAKGKIYGGKSLRENMGAASWDVITLQQYSIAWRVVQETAPASRQMTSKNVTPVR